jgi:proline iminopeptidase
MTKKATVGDQWLSPGSFPGKGGKRPATTGNYDPESPLAGTSWDFYREMWGSHGESVVDGDLKSVEWADRLPRIKVPSLVICGDHDERNPSVSRTIQENIAGSKLVVLPESGHITFVISRQCLFRM